MSSSAEIFDKIGKAAAANPDVATSVDGKFQFNLTGEGGGSWVINLKKGTTSDFVTSGTASDANATVTVAAEDWSAMVAGQLDAMTAFMSGKIKIDGDMTMAMKLPGVMKLAR